MPYQTGGKEVTSSPICARHRWMVDITIMCSDRLPGKREVSGVTTPVASPLFVALKWTPQRADGRVELNFRPEADSATGRISFDEAGQQTSLTLDGDVRRLLTIYGQGSTSGDRPDVVLEVKIDDDVRMHANLSAGDVSNSVAIRLADGVTPVPDSLFPGTRTTLSGAVTPESPGSFRWLSVVPDVLEISGSSQQQNIDVVARHETPDGVESALCVFFKPEGNAPGVMTAQPVTVSRAVSLTGSNFLHLTLRWPDSQNGNVAFLGSPVPLANDRLPYVHTAAARSYQETIEVGTRPGAVRLQAGANPGEYQPPPNTSLNAGTYYLTVPEHLFVTAPQNPAVAWQRQLPLHDIESGAHRAYSIPVVVDYNVATSTPVFRITPPGGDEEDWGPDQRDFYGMALVPSISGTALANLGQDWQRATRQLRNDIGEYPAFDQAQLTFHRNIPAGDLPDVQAQHVAPAEFIRFLPAGQQTFTDISAAIPLEDFLWQQETLTGVAPAQRLPYLPLPKRNFLVGVEALRATFGAAERLVVRTGFIPPNQINTCLAIRNVGGQQGFRANQLRHIFGDAADLDRQGSSFDQQANRLNATNVLIPWPDTPAAQALRGRFSFMQFERIMVNTGPAAIDRHYTLHVDRRDYDLPFLAGVYQFRVGDLTAANGDQTIFNNLNNADANYADVVTVVPQGGAALPNAFYPSNLNAAPPHGHAVFQAINNNPNLDALLTSMDADNMFATINVGPRNVAHDVDVEAIIQEVYDTYGAHQSFLGVSMDLEWYDVGAAPHNATALVQGLVPWIRANHAGKFLFIIWFGATVARLNWTAVQPLADVVVPIYDGAPGHNWGNSARDEWKGFMLNTSVLQHVWDSNHNIRNYGQNLLIPDNIAGGDMTDALSWLGRVSRLYGCTSFAFQFNNYGQNWMGRTANLQPIVQELG